MLVHQTAGHRHRGRIVEVEAYVGEKDRACHASRGRTPRTEVMFGPAGHAYVYLIYGMYHCLNIVTEPEGFAAAVLIRAIEPLEGIDGSATGPGRLCRAMKIDRRHNGIDMTGGLLFVEMGVPAQRIVRTPRVGVEYAEGWARKPWRFYVADSPFVSKVRA